MKVSYLHARARAWPSVIAVVTSLTVATAGTAQQQPIYPTPTTPYPNTTTYPSTTYPGYPSTTYPQTAYPTPSYPPPAYPGTYGTPGYPGDVSPVRAAWIATVAAVVGASGGGLIAGLAQWVVGGILSWFKHKPHPPDANAMQAAPAAGPPPGYGYPTAPNPAAAPPNPAMYGANAYPGAPTAMVPPGANPANTYPGGTYPAGTYPAGTYPAGTYPGGTYPPGTYPAGASPPGTYPPGTYPAGTYPSGTYTGSTNPGVVSPTPNPVTGYPNPGAPTYPTTTSPPGVSPPGAYPSGVAVAGTTTYQPNPNSAATNVPGSPYGGTAPYGATQPYGATPPYSAPSPYGAPPPYGGAGATAPAPGYPPGTYFAANTGAPVTRDADTATAASSASSTQPTLYAGLAYEVHILDASGGSTAVDPASYAFHSGDRFVVHFRPSLPGQMEVYNINASGKRTRIDSTRLAAGQLTTLGPYQFTGDTGDESLKFVLRACSTPELLTRTRDIVNVGPNASSAAAIHLAPCGTTTRGIETRDIQKVGLDQTTSFALDPLSPSEVASGQVAPREFIMHFHHL